MLVCFLVAGGLSLGADFSVEAADRTCQIALASTNINLGETAELKLATYSSGGIYQPPGQITYNEGWDVRQDYFDHGTRLTRPGEVIYGAADLVSFNIGWEPISGRRDLLVGHRREPHRFRYFQRARRDGILLPFLRLHSIWRKFWR